MNTTSKGDSKEKLAIKLVSDMGYTAEDAKRKGCFGYLETVSVFLLCRGTIISGCSIYMVSTMNGITTFR